MQVKGKNVLKYPGPMKNLIEKWNKNKYCKFHKDIGHDILKCFQLKEQ